MIKILPSLKNGLTLQIEISSIENSPSLWCKCFLVTEENRVWVGDDTYLKISSSIIKALTRTQADINKELKEPMNADGYIGVILFLGSWASALIKYHEDGVIITWKDKAQQLIGETILNQDLINRWLVSLKNIENLAG